MSSCEPAPAAAPSPEHGPQDPGQLRHAVTEAWLDVLGPQAFTEATSFFTAGGTSLGALRLIQLLRRAVPGSEFDVADLYNNPTIAAQVAFFSPAEPVGGSAGHSEPGDEGDLDSLLDAVTSGTISVEDAVLSVHKIAGQGQ